MKKQTDPFEAAFGGQEETETPVKDEALIKSRIVPAGINTAIDESFDKANKKAKSWDEKFQVAQQNMKTWRDSIVKNEDTLMVSCTVFGWIMSFAVNKCTGNIPLTFSDYFLAGLCLFLLVQLLNATKIVPLIETAKFVIAYSSGHLFMMYMIAVDGEYWHLFTAKSCQYPVRYEDALILFVGIGIGYVLCSFDNLAIKNETAH